MTEFDDASLFIYSRHLVNKSHSMVACTCFIKGGKNRGMRDFWLLVGSYVYLFCVNPFFLVALAFSTNPVTCCSRGTLGVEDDVSVNKWTVSQLLSVRGVAGQSNSVCESCRSTINQIVLRVRLSTSLACLLVVGCCCEGKRHSASSLSEPDRERRSILVLLSFLDSCCQEF